MHAVTLPRPVSHAIAVNTRLSWGWFASFRVKASVVWKIYEAVATDVGDKEAAVKAMTEEFR